MKLTRCDNHSDREAITTLSIRILSAGSRPLFIGNLEVPRHYVDLCEECRDLILPILKERTNAST